MPRYSSAIQIPNLPAAIALNGQEQLEAVQAGTSVRVTSQQIAGLAFGSLAEVTPGTVLGRFSDSAVGPAEELPISVNSAGNVGIGTSAPGSRLQVNPSAASGSNFYVNDYDTGSGGANRNTYVAIDNYSNDAYGDGFAGRYARGTSASPSAVQNGDILTYFYTSGYDGSDFRSRAEINFPVDGTVSAGNVPTAIKFVTGSTSATERMRITSAGNVGIGTSSPGGIRLAVSGPTDTIQIFGTDGTVQIAAAYCAGSSVGYAGTLSNHRYTLLTNNAERMTVTSSGNVGIGTSAPTFKFQVYPTAASGSFCSVGSYDTGSGGANFNAYSEINNCNNDGYGDGFVGFYARGTGSSRVVVNSGDGLAYFSGYGWDGSAYRPAGWMGIEVDGTPGAVDMPSRITFTTTPDGSASSVERMRITSAGRVGIGTSSPNASALLDVDSTTGGILFPRMTTTQRDAIGSPANGLVIYNTTDDKLQVRAGGSWVDLH